MVTGVGLPYGALDLRLQLVEPYRFEGAASIRIRATGEFREEESRTRSCLQQPVTVFGRLPTLLEFDCIELEAACSSRLQQPGSGTIAANGLPGALSQVPTATL